MPRKSLTALSAVVSLDERRERIVAPVSMPGDVAAIFNGITASVSATHLRQCDVPLIEALSLAIHRSRKATAALDRDGLILDGRMNPHVAIVDRCAKLIASLSVKLRLAPSGRMDRTAAGVSTRHAQARHLDAVDLLLELEDQ